MNPSVDLRTLRCRRGSGARGKRHARGRAAPSHPACHQFAAQALAADTGVSLFRRTAVGLELTRDGALLAAKAEQVLAAATDFNQTAKNLTRRMRGKLRIGTVVDPEFTRLGALLKALVESGPGIETELRHGMSGEVPAGLKRNELDVGFYLGDLNELSDCSEPVFHTRELARLSYRVVAPPSLGGLVRGRDWAELATLPWIGTPPASVHHRLLSRLFDELGVRQNVVALVDQEPSMLAMVRAGVGLSLCREAIALDQQQAHGLVIADRVTLETSLGFVSLNTRRLDPIITRAFDAIARIWATIDL